MIVNLGSVLSDSTIRIPFNTFDSAGSSVTVTNLAAGDVHIHKDGSATQRSSSAGITVSIDFDSITGNHFINIDLSDNTDVGFYAADSFYDVRLEGITVDGQTLNIWICQFRISAKPNIDDLQDLTAAQVNAEVDTALADYDGPTNAEMEARTIVSANYFDPSSDQVTVQTNNDKSDYALTTTSIDAIIAALNAEQYDGITFTTAIQLLVALGRGNIGVAGVGTGTLTITLYAQNGTTPLATFTQPETGVTAGSRTRQ